nr:hypothetical protein CFP56_36528 [Quercus suber]
MHHLRQEFCFFYEQVTNAFHHARNNNLSHYFSLWIGGQVKDMKEAEDGGIYPQKEKHRGMRKLVEILDSDIVPTSSGYQQGSSKEHDRLEDDLKLTGEAQNFGEGTRVKNERVQKGVAKGRSCSSNFRNDGGEKELELTGFEVVGRRWRQYKI